MKTHHYVYILTSVKDPTRRYCGMTNNLHRRLKEHNAGKNHSTAHNRPWQIQIAIAFRCRDAAKKFEKYLKFHAGRAFATKHFG